MKLIKLFLGVLTITAALALQVHAQDWLTNGLVAHYPFNGNANDLAGTNNGVSYGASLTTDRFGNVNSAYSFNGSSSYIKTVRPLQDLTTATFSLWFNASTISHLDAMLSDSDGQISNDCIIQFLILGGGRVGISFGTTKNGQVGGGTITNGVGDFRQPITHNWLHFVWVMTPTTQQAFVNGVQAANLAAMGNDVGYHWTGLVIGAAYVNPMMWHFDGALDDVRIYNRALSPDEVAQLYDIEAPPRIDLMKAVKPSFSHLRLGTNYQMQVSADMSTWTNEGSPFTATNTSMIYPQYWDVENWNSLYFRLQVAP